ncbi:ribonuclease H-like protein [Peniophora sp. CONT]|nr:ribonuclease H-like protein [Peniophora sp. CONT]
MAKGDHLRDVLLYQAEPTITPHDLFCASPVITMRNTKTGTRKQIGRRFVRKRRPFELRECLVYTDASCFNNGGDDAVAESIVAYQPEPFAPNDFDEDESFMGIAEHETYELPEYTLDRASRYIRPSSNRAKLYAAIRALEARPWAQEKWRTLVIAGDLEYVVNGITDWIWKWRDNNWILRNGRRVANVDLWELLLDRILDLDRQGVAVKFWKVPRVKNT